jgi:acetylornithine deacetylase/succinyl-diaminopimelate desuccinylase-like protein
MAGFPILIDREDLVAFTQALIREPSINPPGAEGAVAHILAGYLQALGIEVCPYEVEADRPNVIATWRGGPGPTLLLNGHLDVVPPATGWTWDPFGGEVEDGLIYGRGAADTKGGLAAIAVALRSLRRQGFSPYGTIVFTAVVDEEVGQIGTRDLQTLGMKADFGLVAEPKGLLPMIAHKGRIIVEIRVEGRTAHASLWEQGDNAIDRSLPVLEAINALRDGLQLLKPECIRNDDPCRECAQQHP